MENNENLLSAALTLAFLQDFTVTQLSQALKRTLEGTFGRVRVRGEISGLKCHTSGHAYFSLKDSDAVLNAVCWQAVWQRQTLVPQEGMDVICVGRITSYAPRSNYQIQVEHFELAGEGALLKQLEDLRKRLAAEGLFSKERKKPLPYLPEVIGVITSPTGAVIRDILHRIEDRCPRRVLLWPVAVQGEGAAQQIIKAIEGFNNLNSNDTIARPDVLILARGGGSLEDLWTFNLESVVRAAAASQIPLISAIGHETDNTLIDEAADHRAPTPTAAAEMAVPVRSELLSYGEVLTNRRIAAFRRLVDEKTQRFDDWEERFSKMFMRLMLFHSERLTQISARLRHPRELITHTHLQMQNLVERLKIAITRQLETIEVKIDTQALQLKSYSYHNVLKRGFTMIRDRQNKPITKVAQTEQGMSIEVFFFDGVCQAEISGIETTSSEGI
jgi:exodeoxyribonuclease VII large subunit